MKIHHHTNDLSLVVIISLAAFKILFRPRIVIEGYSEKKFFDTPSLEIDLLNLTMIWGLLRCEAQWSLQRKRNRCFLKKSFLSISVFEKCSLATQRSCIFSSHSIL
uniref:UPAR/Ly6 domain-containing protein n=1 Tax=Parascaris univalens TaxID=6257 RepID=A0A914ZVF4_PARUN